MYPSSLGWWMVTKSGRGVVGPCLPLGCQSSMIFTLIPRTSWKKFIKGIRNIYEDQSNSQTLSGFYTLHCLPILMNDWANLSKKQMTQSWLNIFNNRLSRRNHVSILALHRLGTLSPEFATDNNCVSKTFCSTLHDKSKNTIACPIKKGGRRDD